jgi:hypothetical protein
LSGVCANGSANGPSGLQVQIPRRDCGR